MPFTLNGVGTSYCAARGFVDRGGDGADSDGVVCFVVAYMPILPVKAVHTFNWAGDEFQMIPIKWSLGLVVRAFLRRWSMAFLIAGAVLTAFAITIAIMDREPISAMMLQVGAVTGVPGLASLMLMRATDRRNRRIRGLLGDRGMGTSDPVHWIDDGDLRAAFDSNEMYGTATFADAVDPLLGTGAVGEAMWAARLSAAREDPIRGEQFTDIVLSDPRADDAIAAAS